jgi:hypothetical protein
MTPTSDEERRRLSTNVPAIRAVWDAVRTQGFLALPLSGKVAERVLIIGRNERSFMRKIECHGERHIAKWGFRAGAEPPVDETYFVVLVNLRQESFPGFHIITNEVARLRWRRDDGQIAYFDITNDPRYSYDSGSFEVLDPEFRVPKTL